MDFTRDNSDQRGRGTATVLTWLDLLEREGNDFIEYISILGYKSLTSYPQS